ncbi:Cof-type HAD-IIB family hydrolase [Atopococcus tabaci]|uniref:Cof-type HAD-IIB family hydrolase n=1 Tax=Atopococcus tabaci TaxID=269774 RepID=UPI0003FDC410|nr:Cof-type HAD-IIB family hydrolase [Atopococcus tabaci]
MLKLIASDMDGTLLNEKMAISETNAQAIQKAQQEGIHFIVATGRGYEQAVPLLEEVGLSCPIIALNGAQLFDESGKLIYSRGIEKQQVRDLLAMIDAIGAHGEIMTTSGIFSDNREKRLESIGQMLMELNPNVTFEEALEYSRERLEELHISFVNNYEEILQQDDVAVLKVSAFHRDGEVILEPLQAAIESEHTDLSVTSSHFSNLEINHASAQKGIALEEYAKTLGIEAEEVLAIGDNINDLSMLEWAGYSFAVDNARIEAKRAARYHTSSNVENGVAEAISRVMQNQLVEQPAVGRTIDN